MAHFFMGFISGIVFSIVLLCYVAGQIGKDINIHMGDEDDDKF